MWKPNFIRISSSIFQDGASWRIKNEVTKCISVHALAIVIIIRWPAPAIFEGRAARLLPYCKRRVSEKTRFVFVQQEKEKNSVLTSRHTACTRFTRYRLRSLRRHSDFRNMGFVGIAGLSFISFSRVPSIRPRIGRDQRKREICRVENCGLPKTLF